MYSEPYIISDLRNEQTCISFPHWSVANATPLASAYHPYCAAIASIHISK